MPDADATCSLDLGCPADAFGAFCDQHPDRTVVVYANTSAAVKARADWLVTSSCALDVVRALAAQGQKILWAPDRHLGDYIRRETGADMVSWQGACIVHDEFKAIELDLLMKDHPSARVLVHPEAPADVIALADAVGSTSAILSAAQRMEASEFIVATDNGMLHKLRTLNPGRDLHRGAHRRQLGHVQELRPLCPWMAMNGLAGVAQVLETGAGEVHVEPAPRAPGAACRSTACWLSRPRCGAASRSITWSRASARSESSSPLEQPLEPSLRLIRRRCHRRRFAFRQFDVAGDLRQRLEDHPAGVQPNPAAVVEGDDSRLTLSESPPRSEEVVAARDGVAVPPPAIRTRSRPGRAPPASKAHRPRSNAGRCSARGASSTTTVDLAVGRRRRVCSAT